MHKVTKNKFKIFFLFLVLSFLLTGCSNSFVDKKGEIVQNPKTETTVIDNILCKPIDEDLQNLYKENGKSLKNLPECNEIKLMKWRGIWDTFFVYPAGYIFTKLGSLFGNYFFAIVTFAIFSKIIEYSSSLKMEKQNKILKELQPEVDAINKKFEGKTDTASLVEKGDSLKALYQIHGIKPMLGCLTTFIQFPILIALIEVMYRVPVLASSTVFGINLATSPIVGIKNGNYQYLILAFLLIGLALLQSLIKQDNSKIEKRDILMAIIITSVVCSLVFNWPGGIAIYFLCSYIFTIITKLIIRHKMAKVYLKKGI